MFILSCEREQYNVRKLESKRNIKRQMKKKKSVSETETEI